MYKGIIITLLFAACAAPTKEAKWIVLFNGKDLQGWTPKVSGYEAGVNHRNTFRVEDGVLKVSYTEYDSFSREFGHLFYKTPYSNYRLVVEYRFTGEQPKGGQPWAFMNSGVMFHSQSPESMGVDQNFPVSLEAQFLGGTPERHRSTGNLCTPGMHVTIADTLVTQHCISASTRTYFPDEWVRAELIVWGDSIVHHVIEGDTVMTYTKPVIGGAYLPEGYPQAEGTPVKSGYLALQSESHPIEFRKVELLVLNSMD
ncbi:DUF1080 domain-containing protein [Oscillatoria amoena NRMC-F 0135]|nr:DUF1080 domain-containing protein [Oscillatoria amoena NRMC-F 0135]